MKDAIYYFHQTPFLLAKELMTHLNIDDNDILFEPFKGEGAFYNNFPNNNPKHYTEIEENLDYKTHNERVDWIITNPPFRIEGKNAFWVLLKHFQSMVNKGMAFLVNDKCLSTLTPLRIKELNDNGWYLNKIVVCSVKKWRGRYYFLIFKRENNNFHTYILNNFE